MCKGKVCFSLGFSIAWSYGYIPGIKWMESYRRMVWRWMFLREWSWIHLGLFMGYPCAHQNNIMRNFYEPKQGVIPWSCSEGQPWSITGWLLPLAIVCLVMLVVARPSWFRRTYAMCPVGETVNSEFVASRHHPLDIKRDVVVVVDDVFLNK